MRPGSRSDVLANARTEGPPLQAASLPGDPPLDYLVQVGPETGSHAPLIVAVHGISRGHVQQAERFSDLARRRDYALVAPHFDAAGYDDFQRMGRRGRGARADLALARLIAELKRAGVAGRQVFLFGYSGGGQLVHRYAMAHPDDLAAVVLAAPGWLTFPDAKLGYPYGLRVGGELPGVRLRPSRFLRVPMLVVVGSEDTMVDESLRQSSKLTRLQGRDRTERARRWAAAMQMAAQERGLRSCVAFEEIAGVGHSFEACMMAGLGDRVVEFFDRHRDGCSEGSR